MSLSIPNIDNLIASLPKVVKRHPYIDYKKYPEVVEKVLTILKQHRRGDIPNIASHTAFKLRTLYNWEKALRNDPNFNPLKKKCGNQNRIFTDAEEDAISDYIIENILKAGILFTDEDFEELIMTAFLEKYPTNHEDDNEQKMPRFEASKGFIYDFKKNHGFSTRRCHTKRRPSNKKYDQRFVDAMNWVFSNVDLHYIVNVDETSWEVVPKTILTWHPKGADHVVRYANCNDKEKVTVVAGIAADGSKLPLQFIAKGDSPAVLNTQIGDVGYHMKAYSTNGWSTIETFKEFLIGVRNFYGFEDEHTIHLLLDVFKVHISDEVKETAQGLNIKLYLIPAGMTDELQPLDKKIFGPMKMFARELFRRRYEQDKHRGKIEACEDMVWAWEKLSPETIQDAFDHLKSMEKWEPMSDEHFSLEMHHRAYCTMKKSMTHESEDYKNDE